jgi:Trk K+ transport system NAD-binding subunit
MRKVNPYEFMTFPMDLYIPEESPYEFMTFPMDLYIPEESTLIGKSLEEISKEFEIDEVKCYHLNKESKERENLKDMTAKMKFEKESYILVIGALGELKNFKKTYHLRET